MIPCKEIKCILYPSCIHKSRIECHELHEAFRKFDRENTMDSANISWDEIHKYFPNLKLIHPGEPFPIDYTLLNRQYTIDEILRGFNYDTMQTK